MMVEGIKGWRRTRGGDYLIFYLHNAVNPKDYPDFIGGLQ